MHVHKRGLGRRIREARQAKGWGQEELALASGVRALTISRIERGASVPGLETMVAIADSLGQSLDWLVLGEGRKRTSNGPTPAPTEAARKPLHDGKKGVAGPLHLLRFPSFRPGPGTEKSTL